jgi:hypothetical protein
MSGLRPRCSVGIRFLSALRHAASSYLPELRAWRGARLVELPALRHEIAVRRYSTNVIQGATIFIQISLSIT